MNDLAVLFARGDSIYASFAVDVWCARRDAMRYEGPWPVVAHPPCRAWGKLRHFAKPRVDEKDCALFAVYSARCWGGVVEHPAGSLVWAACGLPRPGEPADDFGGWTLSVEQSRWAHGATKATWLYIVGCPAELVPELPPPRTGARFVENMHVTERERTPPAFAHWLLRLAIRCLPNPTAVQGLCG